MQTHTIKSDPGRPPKSQPLSADQPHFLVRCENFRCLAYRDTRGNWRSVFGNHELPQVLEVYQ